MVSKAKLMVAISSVGQSVGYFGPQKARVRGEVDPEIFLCRVVNRLYEQSRGAGAARHQWVQARGTAWIRASRSRAGAVSSVMPFHPIVIGPAVMTIEIALPFGEEVSDDRLKITRSYPRLKIREHPSTAWSSEFGSRGQ